jgi:transposase
MYFSELLNEYDSITRNYFFILDNAKCHHNKACSGDFKKHSNLLFLSPYSPNLSIVENFFGDIKREVKKETYPRLRDLYSRINSVISEHDELKLARYFTHSLKYMKIGLNCEKISKINYKN